MDTLMTQLWSILYTECDKNTSRYPFTTVVIKTTLSTPIVWHNTRPDQITINDVMFVNACIKNTYTYL